MTTTDRLTSMIASQLNVQHINGLDPITMNQDERIRYITEMVLACTAELHEALNECGWKPWATSKHINEDALFGELRDAWQFLTNLMLVTLQVTPEELAKRLELELYSKHGINIQRVADGYDGTSTKCPNCGRALDDITISEVRSPGGTVHQFCVCHAWIRTVPQRQDVSAPVERYCVDSGRPVHMIPGDRCRNHSDAPVMCVTDVRPAQCQHPYHSYNHPIRTCSECGQQIEATAVSDAT